MKPFDHCTPRSLPEALELLSRHNGQARVVAGGTDLVLQMRNGVAAPQVVVNIKRLPELQGIAYDETNGLRIGALTTLREVTRSPVVQEHYPCLAQAASVMASESIRSFATVGGNLCNASPSADMAPPLIALGAVAEIVGGHGEREIPLEDFFAGPGESALRPGELLRAIRVPLPEGAALYSKHCARAYMDLAVVGVAMRLLLSEGVCQECRIVLGAVAPTPMRAVNAESVLLGNAVTPELIEKAALTAAQECAPIDDIRGSAWYRRRMVGVLLKRGLVELTA